MVTSAFYFKGLFHHTVVAKRQVLEIAICHMGSKTKLYLVIQDYSACFGLASAPYLSWQAVFDKGSNAEHVHMQEAYKIMGIIHLVMFSSYVL